MKKTLPSHAYTIPPNAQRVFKGQIFDVYQWPQKMFDGSTATFEMLRRPDTLQVIAVQDGKLVMVHDEQPGRAVRLSFPGGRADPEDASWLAAAQRELREETGLSCANWRLIAAYQVAPKIEHFVAWFLATEPTGQQAQQLDAGEKITVHMLSFDEVRAKVFASEFPSLDYAKPLFTQFANLQQLLAAPAFQGKDVDM